MVQSSAKRCYYLLSLNARLVSSRDELFQDCARTGGHELRRVSQTSPQVPLNKAKIISSASTKSDVYAQILSDLMSLSRSPYSAFSITKAKNSDPSATSHVKTVSKKTCPFPRVLKISGRP